MSQLKTQNLAFVDVETTGFDPDKHEVIEIGCVLVSQNWPSLASASATSRGGEGDKPVFEVVEEFELKVKPEHIETADPTSLRVNGYDPDQWVLAYNLPEAMKIFAAKTEGAIMVGHNVCFDFSFIDKAFKKSGVENKMHYHKLDTISIAFAKLHGEKDTTKFSLRFLCEYFGIENKKAHTALPDARATFEIYKKLMSM